MATTIQTLDPKVEARILGKMEELFGTNPDYPLTNQEVVAELLARSGHPYYDLSTRGRETRALHDFLQDVFPNWAVISPEMKEVIRAWVEVEENGDSLVSLTSFI